MICICLLTKVSSARNKELGFVFPWKILQQWQDSARSFARWNLQITQLSTSQKKEWESTVRSCMEELDEIPELHHYPRKLVLQETLFPWSLTSSKVMLLLPLCSCHSTPPLRRFWKDFGEFWKVPRQWNSKYSLLQILPSWGQKVRLSRG